MNATDRLLQPYHEHLRRTLTPRRYAHSVAVMDVMARLAAVYDLDPGVAQTIGLLHDLAHDIAPEEQLRLAEAIPLPLQHASERHPTILHAPLGAHLAQADLGITDPVILAAITQHSYCGENAPFSARYAWCLRFADMLEPGRTWQDLTAQLAEPVYGGDLEQGARILVGRMIPFLHRRDLPVHPNLYQLHRQFFDN